MTRYFICALSLSCLLIPSLTQANVWTVPGLDSINAVAVDWNSANPGVVVIKDNQVVHVAFTGGETVLAGQWPHLEGFVEGFGQQAMFSHPLGVAVDQKGNVYVADTSNDRIRRIHANTKIVTTIAGSSKRGFVDGKRSAAQFDMPNGIAVNSDGNLIVADTGNDRIRLVDAKSGEVRTLAGGEEGFADGDLEHARFNSPRSVAIDRDGAIIVADACNQRIRRIDLKSGWVSTLAGSTRGFVDGYGEEAQFNYPTGVAVDNDGKIIVADSYNERIRYLDPQTKQVVTIAGTGDAINTDGPRAQAEFVRPTRVATWPTGGTFVVQFDGQLRFIAPEDKAEPALVALSKTSLVVKYNPLAHSLEITGEPQTQTLLKEIDTEFRTRRETMEQLLIALKGIGRDHQSRVANRLGSLPRELGDELARLVGFNSNRLAPLNLSMSEFRLRLARDSRRLLGAAF